MERGNETGIHLIGLVMGAGGTDEKQHTPNSKSTCRGFHQPFSKGAGTCGSHKDHLAHGKFI